MGFKGDSETWDKLHGIANDIPCSICRDEAQILISADHDLVNIKTDKPVYDVPRFLEFLDIVDQRVIYAIENNLVPPSVAAQLRKWLNKRPDGCPVHICTR